MESAISVPKSIPRSRRRYCNSWSSSSPSCVAGRSGDICSMDGGNVDMSESVKGNAYLCFWEDGSRFEGHLTTDNESHYGLVGRCPELLNPDNVSKQADDDAKFSTNYDVTLVDHDDEESYHFHRVSLVETAPLCSLLSANLTFNAKVIYRGHKADMLIQRYLTPRLVGQNLIVYSGPLSVDINRPTSQPNSWKNSPLWYL